MPGRVLCKRVGVHTATAQGWSQYHDLYGSLVKHRVGLVRVAVSYSEGQHDYLPNVSMISQSIIAFI
ncbi:hypothetical protein CBR_g17756 [Chara braunii]|uniref:Uncharacterized protein n=1 Tax=Chara braunii TaxID=69332 RepID=A0A388KVF9_CHABU|nr:hypothetical protein CBR_g17756 [Chara braunii]|eukprot:GBG74046.1 hypothetical protein CBR_g17756 [Chara braunii]